jgi:hypothetical protein
MLCFVKACVFGRLSLMGELSDMERLNSSQSVPYTQSHWIAQ